MKVILKIHYDSHNTKPFDDMIIEWQPGTPKFHPEGDMFFTITRDDREISVNKEELMAVLRMLEEGR